MADVKQHYAAVLSPVYSWMLGGLEAAVARNATFLAERVGEPRDSAVAVDLGAGSGAQSVPLARLGYAVTAIDLDPGLLSELASHADGLDIACVQGDLLDFRQHVSAPLELAVCMTDTLLHLPSAEQVQSLLADVEAALAPGGRLIATFRDLTTPLVGTDRFLSVRSDADTILTCFLEYELETVKVHDLLHQRRPHGWELRKSWYRKLRLAPQRVAQMCRSAGFSAVDLSVEQGRAVLIATA